MVRYCVSCIGMIEVIRKWYLKALLVFVERNPYVNILPQLDTHR